MFSETLLTEQSKKCFYLDCKTTGTQCADEWGTCNLPANQKCSILYGVDTRWTSKSGLKGAVSCTNTVFGDPAYGTVKKCFYYGCQTDIPPTPSYTIKGAVYNSCSFRQITQTPLPQVTFTEKFGQKRTFSATVNSDGSWSIQLIEGLYQRNVSLNGWTSSSEEVFIASSTAANYQKVNLLQLTNGWKIMIDWIKTNNYVGANLAIRNPVNNSTISVNENYPSAQWESGQVSYSYASEGTQEVICFSINNQPQKETAVLYFNSDKNGHSGWEGTRTRVQLFDKTGNRLNAYETPTAKFSNKNWMVYSLTKDGWSLINQAM
jgi:hypothetical protein